MTQKKIEEWENELRKRIMEWQFAICPTEEEEPYFWKWNEHGMEMLIAYLKEEIHEARQEVIKEIGERVEKEIITEILICHEEGTPTSRLTSLSVNIKNILKSY